MVCLRDTSDFHLHVNRKKFLCCLSSKMKLPGSVRVFLLKPKLSRTPALRRWAISNQNIITFGLRREEFFTSNLNVSVIKRDKSEIGFPCSLSQINEKWQERLQIHLGVQSFTSPVLCGNRCWQKRMTSEQRWGIYGDMRFLPSVFVCAHIKKYCKNWRPLQIRKIGRLWEKFKKRKSVLDECSNSFRNVWNLKEISVFSSAIEVWLMVA